MSCASWSRLAVGVATIDDLPAAERAKILDHLRHCRTCRARALEIDRSLVFDSLSPKRVSAAEVEEIRAAVHTLRRAGELTRTRSMGTWAGRAAAIAALLCVALLLDPGQPEELATEVPFAGALGVGAGQLDLTGAQSPAAGPILEPTDRLAEDRAAEVETEAEDSTDQPTESAIEGGDAAQQ